MERYKVLVEELHHQDDLVHTRVGWPITAQAFLFTSFVLVKSNPDSFKILTAFMIPLIGFISTTIMFISIIAGIHSFFRWRKKTEEYAGKANLKELRLKRSNWRIMLGFIGPILVPLAFIILWLVVLF
jgi:hypothetical protein